MKAPILLLVLASAPEILVPPWPLSHDGERVAVRGGAPLAAEGAGVEPVAPGLFRVVPDPGATAVRLSAGGARAEAPVEAPPGLVDVAVRPAAPVKGRDGAIELELTVTRADGGADPDAAAPDVVASTGRVRDVVATAPGRFRATYEPTATRYPEVAVLLALVPRCPLCPTPRAVGFATVPLATAIDLPGRSEPGARTHVTVGGRTFGPAVADATGRFSVPVVVPPGARFATAESVDRIGNRRTTELDLHLPDVDRLACAAWPRALPADGRAEAALWCVASTAAGAPAPDARVEVAASAGTVAPPVVFRGALLRATFRAPRGGGGEASLTARFPAGGAASTDAVAVALATGAPAELAVRLSRDPVPLGASVEAEAIARDARGDALGPASATPGASDGFVAPGRFVARARAGDLVQRAPVSFALAPGREVATLSLRREGDRWIAEARTVDARPAVGVPLRFGSGAEVATDVRGEASAPARGARESVVAPGGARAAGWEGVVPPASPVALARVVEVALAPAAPVDVVARVEGGRVRWRVEDAAGRALPGRAVSLRSRGVDLGAPERDGDGGRAVIRAGRGPVAVVDDATGVAAVVDVR
jgi:hypothetical protein